jgi:hypothetical protein
MSKYQSAANKRYVRRFLPTMAAYVAVLFASIWTINNWHPTGAALVAISVAPSIPIIGAIVIMGLYVNEEPDEYLRRQMVVAMLGGTAVTLAVATVIGFLQIGKVLENVEAFWAFPLWCASWGLIQCAMVLNNRRTGGCE